MLAIQVLIGQHTVPLSIHLCKLCKLCQRAAAEPCSREPVSDGPCVRVITSDTSVSRDISRHRAHRFVFHRPPCGIALR